MTALYSDSQDRSLKTAYEKESARERLRKSSLLEFSQTFEGREYMSKKATRAYASGAICEWITEDRESA